MILLCNGGTFTFELSERDRHTICKQLMTGAERAPVRHRATRRFIGNLDFTTMQFRPFDRAAAGVEPIDLSDRTEAFIEDN